MIAARDLERLRGLSLFAGFDASELESVASRFEAKRFRKGEVVCRRGDPGDAFYVVASGELEVWNDEEVPSVIQRLHSGDFLGEISLLMGGVRSATVTASRPVRLLSLSSSAFEEELLSNAHALEAISRVLCQRLASNARRHTPARRCTLLGVCGVPGVRGKTLVATLLGQLLLGLSSHRVLHVELAPPVKGSRPLAWDADLASRIEARAEQPHRLVLDAPTQGREGALVDLLVDLADRIGDDFGLVVIDLGERLRVARDACDVVVCLVEQADDAAAKEACPGALQVLNLFNRATRPIPISSNQPFVLPRLPRSKRLGHSEVCERALRDGSPLAPPLRRLAHTLLGRSVGLALGGGAAFGLAHIGVLCVLEEAGIPVDLVAGTSMGSIVGLGWASGIAPRELERHALRLGTHRTMLSALDFTLTRPGILAGNRLISIFGPLLGDVTDFSGLVHPARTVATDVESGERVTIASGSLKAAFRASASVPLVWAPVHHDGRALVDGAMCDPVPAEVVREMGADVCIAVNVVPLPRKGVDTVIAKLGRRVNRVNPLRYLADSRLPNTFDVVMNSIQTLHYELGNFKAISADVRINPDLSDFTWTDFHRAETLIERGADAARRALPEIRRVLEDRSVIRPSIEGRD